MHRDGAVEITKTVHDRKGNEKGKNTDTFAVKKRKGEINIHFKIPTALEWQLATPPSFAQAAF